MGFEVWKARMTTPWVVVAVFTLLAFLCGVVSLALGAALPGTLDGWLQTLDCSTLSDSQSRRTCNDAKNTFVNVARPAFRVVGNCGIAAGIAALIATLWGALTIALLQSALVTVYIILMVFAVLTHLGTLIAPLIVGGIASAACAVADSFGSPALNAVAQDLCTDVLDITWTMEAFIAVNAMLLLITAIVLCVIAGQREPTANARSEPQVTVVTVNHQQQQQPQMQAVAMGAPMVVGYAPQPGVVGYAPQQPQMVVAGAPPPQQQMMMAPPQQQYPPQAGAPPPAATPAGDPQFAGPPQ